VRSRPLAAILMAAPRTPRCSELGERTTTCGGTDSSLEQTAPLNPHSVLDPWHCSPTLIRVLQDTRSGRDIARDIDVTHQGAPRPLACMGAPIARSKSGVVDFLRL
jgi:hypothetical protein